MTNFYVLEPDDGLIFGTKWAYSQRLEPSKSSDPLHCPVCNRMVTLYRWIPPIRLTLSSSKTAKWGDVVWGSSYLLVSGRFKQIYEREGLTGVTKFHEPAEIVKVGTKKMSDLVGVALPIYHAIEIEWGAAALDTVASGVVWKYPERNICAHCQTGIKAKQERVVIKEGTWNGADIFTPRGGPTEVVSQRFKEVVDQYNLTGMWLIPAEKWAYDENRHVPLLNWYVRED